MTSTELTMAQDRVSRSHPEQDHTVVFYTPDVRPETVPGFPYLVIGSAAGQARIVAYVRARDAIQAQIAIMDQFTKASVDSVEVGRSMLDMPNMQGMQMPIARPGLFRRLGRYLFA